MKLGADEINFTRSQENELVHIFPNTGYFAYWRTDLLSNTLADKVYKELAEKFKGMGSISDDLYVHTTKNKFIEGSKVIVGFDNVEDESQFILFIGSYNAQ